jgi:hypothetical protein
VAQRSIERREDDGKRTTDKVMTLTHDDIHTWFRENLEAYLSGGLLPEERRKVEAHAAICAACELALAEARQADATLRDLFAFVAPAVDFEDKLVATVRNAPQRRMWFGPVIRRALVGVAAVILLGGFGLLGNRVLRDGKVPELSFSKLAWLTGPKGDRVKTGSNLRQVGQAMSLYTNENRTYDVRDLADGVPDFDQPSLLGYKVGYANGHKDDSALGPVAEGTQWSDTASAKTHNIDAFYVLAPQDQLADRSGKQQQQAAQDFGVAVTNGTADGAQLGWGKNGTAENGRGLATNATGRLALAGDTTYGFATVNNGGAVNLTQPQAGLTIAGGTVVVADGTLNKSGGAQAGAPQPSVNYWHYSAPDTSPPPPAKAEKQLSAADAREKVRKLGKSLGDKNGDGAGVTELSIEGRKGEAEKTAVAMGDGEAKYKAQTPPTDPKGKVSTADDYVVADLDKEKVKQDAGATSGKPAAVTFNPPLDAVKLQFAKVDDKPDPAKPDAPKPDGAAGALESPPTTQERPLQRRIIRNGTVEFEVDSFDSAFMQIQKIVTEEGGFVSSTDSDKLPNGKVKGTITVRVPPDHLDVLVLKLRGLGDLKTQRIAAQDITKQYTDLESALRAARTMETRLLEIIKSGKGEVKDLVEAEKQLGTYREKIEQIEGELRYYNNLVSLSTLNVTLYERDIRTPTAAFESESVQAGIETEDVEKARADALKAVEDYKGRVIESNLQKQDAGQLTATIVAEVAPEAAGPLTDRLKQIGRVSRLEAERKQTTQGGTGAPTGIKLERRATRFDISLYNLANSNIRPRQTVNITVAAADVEVARTAILSTMRGGNDDKAAPLGRVISSTLTGQRTDQATSAISLEVKAEHAPAIDAVLGTLGETMSRAIAENADEKDVTRAKQGYSISLVSLAQVQPRESHTLNVAAKDVPKTYEKLLALIQNPRQQAGTRILASNLNQQDRQNISGTVDFEVPRSALSAVEAALAGADSEIYSRIVARAPDVQNTLDSKVRLTVSLIAADKLAARESTKMDIEVGDVDKTLQDVIATVDTSGGRVLARQLQKQSANGQIDAQIVLDVPLATAPATLDKLRGLGTVRSVVSARNAQVPAGPLARASFDVTLRSPTPMVSAEDGFGASIRRGLRTSLTGLTYSLMLIVVGLCLVGPFALLGWGLWRVARRGKVKVHAAGAPAGG